MKYPGGGAKRTSERLAQAGNKVLVRFTRPVEQGWVHGYVLIVGTRFFLLALVDDNLRFNGFQCFRLQDVRNLQVPAKYAAFVEAALKARGERHPRTPPVVIDTVQELLRTASRVFPLVTIHRENVAPDICHIGRVLDVSDSAVSLLEIGPDANWDEQSCDYRLKEITRVDFGGGYEEALWLVGGLSGNRPKKTQNAAHH